MAEELYHTQGGDQDGPAFVWPQRTEVEIEQMLQDAYARADEVNAAVYDSGGDETHLEDYGCTEGLDPNVEDFADYYRNLANEFTKDVPNPEFRAALSS